MKKIKYYKLKKLKKNFKPMYKKWMKNDKV